ncbi:ABC transporter related protein [Acidianus hospitalis W1]|uniref:ABC transporter related protein n=1 Tax=Acidianus hospitalis (strain W1) TaxID=933801 RepID=F4B849_ACIHW|nr:ABC transporter ATP-binding protein [Acidianus hospitalis]AEE94873.1 ABC transporter related protein [Acidianus hospitalis W1]
MKLGDREILHGISFSTEGGINVILGPNGSGKTTLLRTIIGMIKPTEGEIQINKRISYVPSEFFPAQMRVKDVLLSGEKKRKIEDYIENAKLLGVEDFLDREFYSLSSGEKRLVLICKALTEGDLVIMDEPLSNLDLANKTRIMNIMKEVSKMKEFLITSHELDIINISNKVIIVKNGEVVYQGKPSDVTEEVLSEVYGVRIRKYEIDGKTIFVVN